MHEAIESLERDPLRNIVLLKHLEAFPERTRVHQVCDGRGAATLVSLDVAASAYDRRTYPSASEAALISSDHPDLTRALLRFVPKRAGVVFKLSSDADRDVITSLYRVERTTGVLSFTTRTRFSLDADVLVTLRPGDAAFDLFEARDYARDWLEPMLDTARAFTCVLTIGGQPGAVCFAFENYKQVWEVGGVFTPPLLRGRGFAARVARTALAELDRQGRVARYQVHDDNLASIRLAESIGLERFLTIAHLLRSPDESVAE
jgi:RimJ/RimL family protein N-acetyltransferase